MTLSRDPNDRILVVDGTGIDKIRTYHCELVERVINNEKERRKINHKGGRRKGSVPWNKGRKNEKVTR